MMSKMKMMRMTTLKSSGGGKVVKAQKARDLVLARFSGTLTLKCVCVFVCLFALT